METTKNNKKKLCLIYNTAPRYREAIFTAIDREYDCDWYFGETKTDIREMDVTKLKHVTYYRTLGNPSRMYVKRGMLRLLFKKKYQNFFMLAESRSLTDWLFFWLASTFFPQKRVYIWTHGWYGKERGIDAKMKLWLFRHVTGTFVYGDRAKRLLVEQGIPEEKLFAIHNSLDYDKHLQLRKQVALTDIYKKHFQNERPTILFLGRLTRVKKLDLVVDALHHLKQRGEQYNLVFVGDGEAREALLQKVSALGMESQTWFYGACYDEAQNAELVYNADLCVSPGNIGLTAMHVLMFGCPVITHNSFEWQMPEFEAVRSGVTGDFFERDNVVSLAQAISQWLSTKQTQREEVRKACYEEIDERWNPNYQMQLIRKSLQLK